jgi:prefoldin subunit 5
VFELILAIIAFCFGMYVAESKADKTIESLSNRILELEEEKRDWRTTDGS